jgi:hypothetical protein
MNMKFAALAVLGTFSLIAAAPQAQAADNGFYLGAGITKSELDVDDAGDVELDDNSFKVIAGIRPLDWLAFEANYIDLGGEEDAGFSVDARAITASALFLAEVGIVDFYARAGLANWDVEFGAPGGADDSDDGWEPTFGAGIGVHFGSIGVRAEYEQFSADLFDEVDFDSKTFSVSFTYTFL